MRSVVSRMMVVLSGRVDRIGARRTGQVYDLELKTCGVLSEDLRSSCVVWLD